MPELMLLIMDKTIKAHFYAFHCGNLILKFLILMAVTFAKDLQVDESFPFIILIPP